MSLPEQGSCGGAGVRGAAVSFAKGFGAGERCVVLSGWEPWSCQAALCWWVLCLGCWHVQEDVTSLGAVTAGGS